MKLALILAVYKRHDLERIVLERLVNQSKKYRFEIIVAGSEGELSKGLCKDCHYIEVENFPVSNKHNALLEKAKDLNVDGVVLLGSDDLLSDGYFDWVYKQKPTSKNVLGLKDIFFYDTKTKKGGVWNGYKNGTQSVGAGRFFSKYILEKVNYKLWSDGINSGLDSDCTKNLKLKGIGDDFFKMEDINAYCVDIKHTNSISNRAIVEVCDKCDMSVFDVFGDEFKTISEFKEPDKVIFVSKYEGLREYVSTGKSKWMRYGEILKLSCEEANVLIGKGFVNFK